MARPVIYVCCVSVLLNRHGTTTYNENKGPRADQAKPGQLIDAVLADGIP